MQMLLKNPSPFQYICLQQIIYFQSVNISFKGNICHFISCSIFPCLYFSLINELSDTASAPLAVLYCCLIQTLGILQFGTQCTLYTLQLATHCMHRITFDLVYNNNKGTPLYRNVCWVSCQSCNLQINMYFMLWMKWQPFCIFWQHRIHHHHHHHT